MKTYKGLISSVLMVFALIAMGNFNLLGQGLGDNPGLTVEEQRPFDFKDKYYASQGVSANMIIDRRNGTDGFSVLDHSGDQKHNEIRIIATRPAYGPEGEILFWNFYGKIYKDGFTPDAKGQVAYDMAHNFPIYTFPGESRAGDDRQAPIIGLGEGYFEKNVLGLGVNMSVKFRNDISLTKMDISFLKELGNRNGMAADGMPIVRTAKELGQLQSRNLVTVSSGSTNAQQAGDAERTPTTFFIGRVIQNPKYSITPDAFLVYTKNYNGEPLESELSFLKKFECLKMYGSSCY